MDAPVVANGKEKKTKPPHDPVKRAQEKADSLRKTIRSVDWRDLTPIGFEFGTWDEMKKEKWSFDNLEEELQDGVLAGDDHPFYMFMGAQPIVENKVAYNMPYIVVVDCKTPPPNTICKASIQGGGEEIYPMEQFHLKWSPYIRSKYVNMNLGVKVNYPLISLNLQERPGKRVSEEKAKNLEYLLPYIRLPQISEKLKEQEVVAVNFPYKAKLSEEKAKELLKARKEEKDNYEKLYQKWKSEPRSKKTHAPAKPAKEEPCTLGEDGSYYKVIELAFDKGVDRLSDFVPEFIEDNGLDEDEDANIRAALKSAFEEKRKIVKEKFAQMIAEVAAYSKEQREDYENIKVYKFYPSHPVFKVAQYVDPQVNRFFGHATQTFPNPLSKLDFKKLSELDEKTLKAMEEKEEKKKAKEAKEAAAAASKKKKSSAKKTEDVEMKEKEQEQEQEEAEQEEAEEVEMKEVETEEAEEEATTENAEEEAEEEAQEEEKEEKKSKKSSASKKNKKKGTSSSTKVSKTKEVEEPKAAKGKKSTASKKVTSAKKSSSKK